MSTFSATTRSSTHNWSCILRKSSRPLTWPLMNYFSRSTQMLCSIIRYRYFRTLSLSLSLSPSLFSSFLSIEGVWLSGVFEIQIRTFNVEKTKNMRQLNPEDIDQLITISGMVIRNSQLIPEMREGGCDYYTLIILQNLSMAGFCPEFSSGGQNLSCHLWVSLLMIKTCVVQA